LPVTRRKVAVRALVYDGTGNKAIEDRQKPQSSTPAGAVVELLQATICGTDLRILKGEVPTCTLGLVSAKRVSARSITPSPIHAGHRM
jgi:threonine dehydrogenase-like Zn-dependent dehydrogenase